MEFELSPQELQQLFLQKNDIILLDVREPEEYQIANLGGTLIPLAELPSRFHELAQDKHIVVMCHHGVRSANAVRFLQASGLKQVQNLSGGIDRWSLEVDANIARY